MRILFVTPYPEGEAPSQRFRFEQYYQFLALQGWTYTIAPFLDLKTWRILYKPGHVFPKALGILKGFIKRFFLLFRIPFYDFIFIHREATPIGPPWFEWGAAKVFRKRIIYDFDDAIWIPNTSVNNKIVAGVKWHHKVSSICKWAYKVSCGNTFLMEYACQFNKNAFVIPTTLDTLHHHNVLKNQFTEKMVIGWTGTHSTMKYLESIIPVIQQLENKYEFEFWIISNHKPNYKLNSLVFKPWNKQTEINDLLNFNVGIMPLEDDPWAKGKCAFKALQYMALGMPALVSPVGMNKEVVDHGVNGFICDKPKDWLDSLELIIRSADLRNTLGREAAAKIEQNYSVKSNKSKFLKLFS